MFQLWTKACNMILFLYFHSWSVSLCSVQTVPSVIGDLYRPLLLFFRHPGSKQRYIFAKSANQCQDFFPHFILCQISYFCIKSQIGPWTLIVTAHWCLEKCSKALDKRWCHRKFKIQVLENVLSHLSALVSAFFIYAQKNETTKKVKQCCKTHFYNHEASEQECMAM